MDDSQLYQQQQEEVKAIINQNNEQLRELIKLFSEAPEGQMDAPFVTECKEFLKTPGDGDKSVFFLRNLRDKLAHTGGSTDFVIGAISAALAYYPEEDAKTMSLRRANLAKEMGISNKEPLMAPQK